MNSSKLKGIIKDIFIRHKLSKEHASICAEALINAELVGAPSHGLSRLKMYCDRINKKVINPKAKIKVKKISQSIAQPSPSNGQFRTTYQFYNGVMNCVFWNQSGAPMDGTIYSDDNNWKYTAEWASDPTKQVGNPLVNSVEIKAVPCVTSTVSGVRVCK